MLCKATFNRSTPIIQQTDHLCGDVADESVMLSISMKRGNPVLLGSAHKGAVRTTIGGMLMVTFSIEEAQSRLGITAANFQKAVDHGDLRVEHTNAGVRVTEAAMADFRRGQRERKLRGMQDLTAFSNDVGFTE